MEATLSISKQKPFDLSTQKGADATLSADGSPEYRGDGHPRKPANTIVYQSLSSLEAIPRRPAAEGH